MVHPPRAGAQAKRKLRGYPNGMSVRVRYAPSPTGFPHVGNLRTALFNWLFARHEGGKFILRIEDTDRSREVEGGREAILESLRWLGLTVDEGPEEGGPYGPYVQSERSQIYKEHVDALLLSGAAYKCYCSAERLTALREEQQANKQPTMYDRRCRSLPAEHASDDPHVIRLAMPTEGVTTYTDYLRGEISFENALLDDQVLVKTDGYPTYHFANVVDDHLMEITHVMRAEEWLSSVPKHVRLYEAFGWQPPVWCHPSILLGPDKQRLSKRHGATGALEFREEGFLPEAMVNFLALCGWSPGDDREIMTKEELIAAFSLDGIQKSPGVFDHEKLKWMNGHYIREMSSAAFAQACLRYLDEVDPGYAEKVVGLEQERVRTLSEIAEATSFFFDEKFPFEEKGVEKWFRRPETPAMLDALATRVEAQADWSHDALEGMVGLVAGDLGLESRSPVIHVTRVATTGRTAGPGLFDLLSVLGKERVLRRIARAKAYIMSL